jgi:hypothetical protein
MRRHRRSRALIGAVCAALLFGACRFTGFNDPVAKTAAKDATNWLRGHQLADGSFELAGFPGFETPDAVLAIAENAQTTATWDPSEALDGVNAVTKGGNSGLHALDDLADAGLDAGQAAKLVVLDTEPLGLSATAFNPDGDAGSVNLEATITAGAQPNGSYGAFNATLYAAIALRLLHDAVPANTLAYIRGAQQANGGWSFSGLPGGTDLDIDTTGLAIQALAAAKVKLNDVDLRQGLAFLAAQHQANGAWQAFGSDDPNSTSVAAFALTAAGFDPNKPCWRDVVTPGDAGDPYTSPIAWLETQQKANGRIASPNDGFGINTFATTQSIEAFRRAWVPVTPIGPQQCPEPENSR